MLLTHMYLQQTATLIKWKIDFFLKNRSDLYLELANYPMIILIINICWDIQGDPMKIKWFMGSSIYQIRTASSSEAGQSNCTL